MVENISDRTNVRASIPCCVIANMMTGLAKSCNCLTGALYICLTGLETNSPGLSDDGTVASTLSNSMSCSE